MSSCSKALAENTEYSELNNRGKRMTIPVNNAVSLLDVLLIGEDNSATAESNPSDTIPHNDSIHWRTKGQSARTLSLGQGVLRRL